jgi:signal transduction histidine kinase
MLDAAEEPTAAHLRLLTGIAEIAGSALDRALVLETLEHRVASRTHELRVANEQLQQLDRLKSKFVSDVSHELRTPITNLNLYLDLMLKGKEERREHYLAVLQQQTRRLNNLLEDILSLSRLEMGQANIQMAPVDLNRVIEQVVTAHLPRAEMSGLKVRLDLHPDLPPVWGERNQLAQVITNLLTNALNYTPQGVIRVQTWRQKERNQACLQVSDTGLGILKADRPYLFDRFYRGQQAGQSAIPGTGLGLAIVKEIVDLHRGEIAIESEAGEGTTFTVYLPLATKES